MQTKTLGLALGALGVLFGASSARAGSSTDDSRPSCRDSGVRVSFESGSSDLDLNARGALNGIATWLKLKDGRTIRLPGSPEKKGSPTASKRLGERRSAAVKDYLLGQGIDPERIALGGPDQQADRERASGRTLAITTCEVATSAAGGTTTGEALPEENPFVAPEMPGLDNPPAAPTPRAETNPLPPEPPAMSPLGSEPPAMGNSSTAPEPPVAVVPPPGLAPVAPPVLVPVAPLALAPAPPPAGPPPPVAALPAPEPPPTPLALAVAEPPPVVASDRPPSWLGIEATVGGGVVGFVDQGTRAFANTGGSWEARMTFGSRFPIAFEAAYVGSLQEISALGLATNALLLGNGGEGTLRINLTTARVQPYLFGGGGFIHYRLTNTSVNTSSVQPKDNAITVPTGVGLSVRVSRELFVDLRGTYRFAFDDQLFSTASADAGAGSAGLDSWNAIARIGFEF